MSDEKLVAVIDSSLDERLFSVRELVALKYADAMTFDDVGDDLFSEVSSVYSEDEIVELTAVIAWENSSARFNRALRVPSQGLWQRSGH